MTTGTSPTVTSVANMGPDLNGRLRIISLVGKNSAKKIFLEKLPKYLFGLRSGSGNRYGHFGKSEPDLDKNRLNPQHCT
jgi:hypothetical protein